MPTSRKLPTCRQDVLTLLSATLEMAETYADRPIITMSMSGTGVISRLTGEFFGSALTFGAAAKASAPGQIPVSELETVLSQQTEKLVGPYELLSNSDPEKVLCFT